MNSTKQQMNIIKTDIGKRIIYRLYDENKNYGEIIKIMANGKIRVNLDNLKKESKGKIIECDPEELIFDFPRDKDFKIILKEI